MFVVLFFTINSKKRRCFGWPLTFQWCHSQTHWPCCFERPTVSDMFLLMWVDVNVTGCVNQLSSRFAQLCFAVNFSFSCKRNISSCLNGLVLLLCVRVSALSLVPAASSFLSSSSCSSSSVCVAVPVRLEVLASASPPRRRRCFPEQQSNDDFSGL